MHSQLATGVTDDTTQAPHYYIVRYAPGAPGCPYFLHGDHAPDRYEWNSVEPITPERPILRDYSFTVTDPALPAPAFDFYGRDSWFVSAQFLVLCSDLDVRFRAVPLKMLIRGSAFLPTEYTAKRYAIFLPCDDIALLDRDAAEYADDTVLETGAPMTHSYFPSVSIYASITRFVAHKISTPALFRCLDIVELVCTEAFMLRAQADHLQGLTFVPPRRALPLRSLGLRRRGCASLTLTGW